MQLELTVMEIATSYVMIKKKNRTHKREDEKKNSIAIISMTN